ncbi:MAG TPA: carboxypeptidase-like regulatory domain-containing protein [Gemmatimonadaceae bacterium]|nr:carboxypeptidase-like regulatory domain-containing protein [Gemmatimonadaceae bacterium]
MNDMFGPRKSALLILIGALAATLSCGDQAAPSAPLSGDAEILGSVTSEKTSAGIPGLVVALLHQGAVVRATPTDSNGAFQFRSVARGNYTVQLTGFELAHVDLRYTAFTPVSTDVTVGAEPANVVFAAVGLIAPHIVGTITCGGTPVSGAAVRVIGGETDDTVTTNAQGKYGATDLSAGHYAVIVLAAPCTITPPYAAAALRPGQAATVDFHG